MSRSPGRQYLIAVLLLGLGAIGSWWALAQPWLEVTESLLGGASDAGGDPAFGAATAVTSISGASLIPLAAAMPALLLAGIAGVVGTRGVGRRIVGGAVTAAAIAQLGAVAWAWLGPGLASFAPPDALEVRSNGLGPALAVAAAGLAVAGGLLVLMRGSSWATLGRSYERAGGAPRDAWEALDEGIDPTIDPTIDPNMDDVTDNAHDR